MRKTLQAVIAGLLAVGALACADKTASTPPAVSDDARLHEVERILRDVDADLSAAEQDAATPEGDPTR